METTVRLNYLRIAPRKVRLVADAIRRKSVADAERVLSFLPNRAARPLAKLLQSAKANLRSRGSRTESLEIKEIRIDPGPSTARWIPRAMGRATPILKRTSQVTLVVGAPDLEAVETAPPPVQESAVETRVRQETAKPRLARQVKDTRIPTGAPGMARRIFRRKSV